MARTRRLADSAIIGLAIAMRVAAVLVLQSHQVPRSTYEHGEIAANLLAGHGFSMRFLGADGPTSQQAPIYPTLVALAFAIGGVESPQALLLLELGQSLLGGLLVLGMLKVARHVAPERPWLAWATGLLVALHPTLIYAATHVQIASLATMLFVWTLALAYETAATGRSRAACLTGGLLALLVLTDPILAMVSLGVAWAIWQSADHKPSRIRRVFRLLAIVAVTSVAGVTPWLVRNALVHGEFVAIKSTFGYAFWQGNCALSEGTDKVVRPSVDSILERGQHGSSLADWNRLIWKARHEAGYLDDIVLTRDDYLLLGSVSEPERSRILFRRTQAELKADPDRYRRLCLQRLRYFILFDETNPKSKFLIYRVPHLGLTIVAALGLILAGPELRRRLMPTIVTVAAIVLFHSLTIVSARFHIPIEPLMALWGAAGLVRMVDCRSSRTRAIDHSAATRHHVKGVRVESRLAVTERVAGVRLLLV
jgi:hypothetical protein